MEDKTFELLTKMYGEFSEFRKEVKNDIIRLEDKLDTGLKTLFDGYEQTYEKVVHVWEELNDLSSKLEKQEVEIKVIKGGK